MRPYDYDEGEGERKTPAALYVEDALIVLAIVALFILTVFFRTELWGQVGLAGVLLLMVIVLFFRFRRVHRAFTGRDEEE